MTDTKDLRADAEWLADNTALDSVGRRLNAIARRINKAADKIDQLTAEASLYEDSLASYAQENAELKADAERWRYFVKHKTFWRASQCIQYGGEVSALRPGGPGDYELKKLSFDADIDEARAALAKQEMS